MSAALDAGCETPEARLVSVLTPLYRCGVQYLGAAWESLRAQELPNGWSLEWVVQDDAASPVHAELVAALTGGDRRVRYGHSGRHCGQAVARTMAFGRSHGAVVYALDQDDELAPGALAAMAAVLVSQPNVVWVTGRTRRRFPDGSVVERVDPISCGGIPAGELLCLFEQGVTTAFYPTATMFRRWALQLLGAWPAVVAAEDAELQLVMGAAFDGYRVDQVVLTRRKWPGQAVAAPWYHEPNRQGSAARYTRAAAVEQLRVSGRLRAVSEPGDIGGAHRSG